MGENTETCYQNDTVNSSGSRSLIRIYFQAMQSADGHSLGARSGYGTLPATSPPGDRVALGVTPQRAPLHVHPTPALQTTRGLKLFLQRFARLSPGSETSRPGSVTSPGRGMLVFFCPYFPPAHSLATMAL